MITLQQMHYIVVLSEELHFQKASDRCFVSQPTLSMQIKKAEELLGNLIFDRSGLPIKITPFGHTILPILRDIIQENEKLTYLTNQLKGNLIEEIKIGIIPTVGVYMIPRIFSILKENLEKVKIIFVEMKSEDLLQAFDQHKIDLGIMAGPYLDFRLESILLYKEQILVYCPEFKGDHLTLDQLKESKPWLLSNGNCLRNQMWEFCQLDSKSNSFEWDYQGGSIEILMKMVEQNGGYTLIPENIDVPNDKRENLKTLTHKNLNPAREVIALFPKRTIKSITIKEIIKIIKRNVLSSKNDNLTILNWK